MLNSSICLPIVQSLQVAGLVCIHQCHIMLEFWSCRNGVHHSLVTQLHATLFDLYSSTVQMLQDVLTCARLKRVPAM